MNKVKNAIIMAAGKGERMYPITLKTPKPLIPINGTPIIEQTIQILQSKGIMDIYIVVGHLKEKFLYLSKKYNVSIVENPYYETCNNISSMYAVKEHLGDSIVLDGDVVIIDDSIIKKEFDCSGYCSCWTNEKTNEWLQIVDNNDYVIDCSRSGGQNGWVLYSISYWSFSDAQKLMKDIEYEFFNNKNTNIYWDDVAMFCYPEKYHLKIKRIDNKALVELDNIKELAAFDKTYKKYLEDPHE